MAVEQKVGCKQLPERQLIVVDGGTISLTQLMSFADKIRSSIGDDGRYALDLSVVITSERLSPPCCQLLVRATKPSKKDVTRLELQRKLLALLDDCRKEIAALQRV